MEMELLELAIAWRELSCRIFFRDRVSAELAKVMAEDLLALAVNVEEAKDEHELDALLEQ